jgi:hypothetical protein
MALPANRNAVGASTMASYVLGVVCFVVGIYISTITRIYIYTGQETHPYLKIGLPLVIGGIAVVAWAQAAAKRSLHR